MRLFILYLIFTLTISCENDQIQETTVERDSNSASLDSLNYIFSTVFDSLKNNPETKELGIAIENFYDKKHIPDYKNQTEYYDQNYFLANFKLLKFNTLKVLVADCNHQFWEPTSLHLYFYDDIYQLKHVDSISGNRYHNGEIKIMDWDNDGEDEIVFNLIQPVSSVAFHEWQKVVYKFTCDEGLSNIFEIINEEIDCGLELDPNFGVRTTRADSLVSKNKLKITETTHKYDCDMYDVDPVFNSDDWLTKIEYVMVWNEDEGRFTESKK